MRFRWISHTWKTFAYTNLELGLRSCSVSCSRCSGSIRLLLCRMSSILTPSDGLDCRVCESSASKRPVRLRFRFSTSSECTEPSWTYSLLASVESKTTSSQYLTTAQMSQNYALRLEVQPYVSFLYQ